MVGSWMVGQLDGWVAWWPGWKADMLECTSTSRHCSGCHLFSGKQALKVRARERCTPLTRGSATASAARRYLRAQWI